MQTGLAPSGSIFFVSFVSLSYAALFVFAVLTIANSFRFYPRLFDYEPYSSKTAEGSAREMVNTVSIHAWNHSPAKQ